MTSIQQSPIIIFDGVCNLCNNSVKFILKFEKKETFKFATLQSEAAQTLIATFKHEKFSDSVILIAEGKLFQESTAALKIARKLKYFWILYYLIFIPDWIRNPMYRWIARNRYKWFGKKEYCMIPDEKLKLRFL